MTHQSYTNQDYRELKNLKSILMGINFLKGEDLFPISNEQKHMAVSLGETSYERLELVGDSILRQIISDYLFIRYRDMDQGGITKLRSLIENGSSLAEMARRIGLPKYMLIPRNLEATGAREKNNKFQCDIFEAFIAALYYDSMEIKYSDIGTKLDLIKKSRGPSFDLCFQFVTNLIEDEIDLSLLLENEINHKDELLQQYHKLGWGDPKYNVMDIIIDNNKMGKKSFKMYVRDNDGNIIGTGTGSSKQKGEKIAAKKALQYLKIIPDDNDDIILAGNSTEIYFKNKKILNNNSVHDHDHDHDHDLENKSESVNDSNNLNHIKKTKNKPNSEFKNNLNSGTDSDKKSKSNFDKTSNNKSKYNDTTTTIAEKIKLSISCSEETKSSDIGKSSSTINSNIGNLRKKV
jgi:ribonuclease-3